MTALKHAELTTPNYTVEVYPPMGYFEHRRLGEDSAGGLWFDDEKNLIDYDGVWELPAEVCDAIKKLGCNVPDEFYPDPA